MSNNNSLTLRTQLPVHAMNAGLFISRGMGRHPERVIDSYELIYVRQGRLGMCEGEQEFEVQAGQTLLLWPDRRHGGTQDYPPDLRFYWMHFALTAGAGEAFTLPQLATVARPDRLTAYFRAFLDDQESGVADPVRANLLVLLLLTEAAHVQQEGGEGSHAGAVLAQRADAYLRVHFTEPISTASIAQALDCNPDYLGRVFSAAFGLPVTEAIHRRRLRHACALLLESDYSVEMVARQCGFDDAGYFRRLFRRYQGMPPIAYRRLYARTHVNSL